MASASLLLRFLDLLPALLSPAEGGGPALGGGVPAGGGLPSSTIDSGPYPVKNIKNKDVYGYRKSNNSKERHSGIEPLATGSFFCSRERLVHSRYNSKISKRKVQQQHFISQHLHIKHCHVDRSDHMSSSFMSTA